MPSHTTDRTRNATPCRVKRVLATSPATLPPRLSARSLRASPWGAPAPSGRTYPKCRVSTDMQVEDGRASKFSVAPA